MMDIPRTIHWAIGFLVVVGITMVQAKQACTKEDDARCSTNYAGNNAHYCRQEWIQDHCPKMCDLCAAAGGGSAGGGSGGSAGGGSGGSAGGDSACKDIADCTEYAKNKAHYCPQSWTKKNCRKTCGLCAGVNPVNPVNGGWSRWSGYGVCTKPCGGGRQTKTRQCNNPAPKNGGKKCIGEATSTQRCNRQSCGGAACDDNSQYATRCGDWANDGECKANPVWMKNNCCKSCLASGGGNTGGGGGGNTGGGGGGNTGGGGGGNTGGGGGGSTVSGEKAECLKSANSYRRKHRDTNDLVWDAGLASDAQAYAQTLLAGAQREDYNWFRHDENRGKQGENLAYRNNQDPEGVGIECRDADKRWYDEIRDYNWNGGSTNGKQVLHFTQMVWAKSTKVGYGVATGPAYGRYAGNTIRVVVARYLVRGNWGAKSAYRENVRGVN